jgi:DNA-binding NtrC family response regulator/pSer/pThr/pTyr-binding forkhead associated (FHA) protein
MPCFVASVGNLTHKEFAFPVVDLITIGRSPRNDIALLQASRKISRFHAAVVRCADSDNTYFIRDLGSVCSIRVNGIHADRKILANGDIIHIAEYKLQYFSRNQLQKRSSPLRVVPRRPPRPADRITTQISGSMLSKDVAFPERQELLEELQRQSSRGTPLPELITQTMKLLLPVLKADRGFVRIFLDDNRDHSHDMGITGLKDYEEIEITDEDFLERLKQGEVVIEETTMLAPILSKKTFKGFFCIDWSFHDALLLDNTGGFLIALGGEIASRPFILVENETKSHPKDHFRWPVQLVGKSRQMEQLTQEMQHAAASDINVLLIGETGTGKELVAREVHKLSGKRQGPFEARHCGQITESLAEIDIFGYGPKSGISGARPEGAPGWFQLANGGTLLLDEIHTLSPVMQDKFLRVLQEKEVRPYAVITPLAVDVKVIAATDIDLEAAMLQGTFRKPLYFRFGIKLHLPPLRERKEDILLLAYYFLDNYADELNADIRSISRRALHKLIEYDWPGNVRELESLMRKAIHPDKKILFSWDLEPDESAQAANSLSSSPSSKISKTSERTNKVLKPMTEVEKEKIMEALEVTHGNITQTADILGFSRQTLVNKMDSFGIPRNYGDAESAQDE